MRILIVHNAYQQRGGEDAVVENEIDVLRSHGHSVKTWIVSNAAITGMLQKAITAISAVFSLRSHRQMLSLIQQFRPDVVHVHNFFPLVSPSVFYACHKARVPSVLTLHNFRILCPTSVLMHDGIITEKSLRDGPWWAVAKRTYRGSLIGTFALAMMISVHRHVGTWSRRVTRFIALNRFAAATVVHAGLPASRISVKANFVDVAEPLSRARSGLLFVGRLSREKGVDVLAEAVRLLDRDRSVRVAGDGPLSSTLSNAPGVVALGGLDATSVYREMASAHALVIPSLCYEGFPMVLVEAYACGLPVIASRLGALGELVEEGVTGLLFEPGSAHDLADKMRWALGHPGEMAKMGRAARERYEARYTSEENYKQLMAIYGEAISAEEMRSDNGG